MFKTLATLIFIFSGLVLYGQECNSTLSGRVIDFHDNSVLEGALIQIRGSEINTVSDSQGRYSIDNLCNDSYDLVISHPECEPVFVTLVIKGDTVEDILLEHHIEELEEVQVVGDVIKDKTSTAQEQSLKTIVLEQYSSASLGDALKEISGVSSLNTGANIVKPIIHGLSGSRVLILNDGIRLQDMEWGEEHAPNVDINSTGSVSVIKGASALQYGGDAIGGVILMEQTFNTLRDTVFGKTLLNGMTNGQGGNISSELTKVFNDGWFVKGQASYKKLGDREAPDYVLSNTGIEETGITVRFGRKTFTWGWDAWYSYYDANIGILRASHIGNVDDLIRSINSMQPLVIESFTYDINPPRQEVTHHLAKLKVYKRFEGVGRWNFQYDFQLNNRLEFDVRVGDDRDTPAIDLELTTHTVNTDFKWDANSNYKIRVGILGRLQDNFADPDTGVRRLIPDYDRYDLGLFAIGDFQVSDHLLVEAGLRYDYNRIDALKFFRTSRWLERGYDQDFADIIVEDLGTQLLTNPDLDFHNISATIGLQYKINGSTDFRFNYSLAQRAPNPSELFSDGLHHSAARIELGDLRIDQETSNKLAISLEKSYKNWGFTLEPYANFVSDFILLEPTGVEFTIRGAFPVWEYRQTDARLLGVDMSAYANWSPNWRTDHRFSIVKGNDTDSDIALINMPAPNTTNRITYSRPEWKNFEIGLESFYSFRQNEFPPNIIVFSPEQQQDVLLEINTPPESYHLIGFYSNFEIPVGNKSNLGIGIRVDNLLNTNYRDYLNRLRYFADDLGRNIILQLKFNY